MKAEVAKSNTSGGDSTVAPTPDRASTPDVRDVREQSNGSDETLRSSSESDTSATSRGKQKVTDAQPSEEPTKKKEHPDAGNLVGKINNLVTTDLANVTNARDFLYLRWLNFTTSEHWLYSTDINKKLFTSHYR